MSSAKNLREIKSHKNDLVHWSVDVDSLNEWTKKHHAHKNPRTKKTDLGKY
jgi:hypothetical protein